MFMYLLGIIILLCVVHILCNYNERARLIKKIPGPDDAFIVGNGLTIIRSAVEIMKLGREYAQKWNGIYRIWIWPYGAVFIYNPEDIELVMSSMKYGEKSLIYDILKPWLKDGLLLSNGAKWQERRKLLTPAFHFNILRQFCVTIEENTQRLLERLKESVGEPIDVMPVISDYTLNAICETSMGTQLSENTGGIVHTYKKAVYEMGEIFLYRFIRFYLYSNIIFNLTPFGRRQKKTIKILHNFTANVIKTRRENQENHIPDDTASEEDDKVHAHKKKSRTAMLDLLISADRKGLIDKAGIQEEVDTFMFEGHDTTASGLTFLLMLLANHKNIQDEIVNEVKDIFGDSKRWASIEDLAKMKYLERCIKESLRIYPPVHFISRTLNESTILSNYRVPAGTLCNIAIFDLHHRPDLFENPEEFNPDRFLPENIEKRHPYAFIPFSAGPRNCIGQKFAMMQMKIAVIKLLREFELIPVTRPADIQLTADLILRNNGPIKVNFVKRQW